MILGVGSDGKVFLGVGGILEVKNNNIFSYEDGYLWYDFFRLLCLIVEFCDLTCVYIEIDGFIKIIYFFELF